MRPPYSTSTIAVETEERIRLLEKIEKDAYVETFYVRLIGPNNRPALPGNQISLSNYSKQYRTVVGIEYSNMNSDQVANIDNYGGTGLSAIPWATASYLYLNLLDKNNVQLIQNAPITGFSSLTPPPGYIPNLNGNIRRTLLDVDFAKSYLLVAPGNSFGNNEMIPITFHFLDR